MPNAIETLNLDTRNHLVKSPSTIDFSSATVLGLPIPPPQTITLTGAVTGSGAASINTTFRPSAAYSVLGRAFSTSGAVADISGAAGQVLRVAGGVLGFGTIDFGTSTTGTVLLSRGGTGGTDAPTARTNLGLAIGTNVEAYLGNPSTNGYLLSSTTAGVRSWIPAPTTGIGGSTGSTDNAILRADGTGGATLQGSGVAIDDGGNITGFTRMYGTGSGNYIAWGDMQYGDVTGLGKSGIGYNVAQAVVFRDNSGNVFFSFDNTNGLVLGKNLVVNSPNTLSGSGSGLTNIPWSALPATITNKTLDNTNAATFNDGNAAPCLTIRNASVATKTINFVLSGLTAQRTITPADGSSITVLASIAPTSGSGPTGPRQQFMTGITNGGAIQYQLVTPNDANAETYLGVPSTNGYILSSTTAGVRSWIAPPSGGGTPGGANTNIQFNDAGVFGGEADFTWNKTSNILALSASGPGTITAFNEVVLQQTNDIYGITKLRVVNRGGSAGAIFENVGLDIVDFGFKTSTAAQFNLRYEHRAGQMASPANTAGEFQFHDIPTANFFAGFGVARAVFTQPVAFGQQNPGSIPVNVDVGIARNAAGILEVNNATAGTLATLKAANLNATGQLQINGTSITTLFEPAFTTLSNKTLDNTNTVTLKDTLFAVHDEASTTKQIKFELAGLTAQRTITPADGSSITVLASIAPTSGSGPTGPRQQFMTGITNAGAIQYQLVTPNDANAETYLGTPSADGYILSSTIAGVRSWIAPGAGGAVSSVFTRTGAVTAQSGDYAAYYAQLTAANVFTQNQTMPKFTMTIPASTAKGRLGTLSGVSDWMGLMMNADYSGGWNLDDTTKRGWVFEMDSRIGLEEFSITTIPAGANPHTNEVQVLTLAPSGLMTVTNRITGVGTPTGATDAATKAYVDARPGTTTNDNAAPGVVGETISNSIAAGGSLATYTTNQTKNFLSISLTAGDWDVRGCINWLVASFPANTVYPLSANIGTTTNTITDDGEQSYNLFTSSTTAANGIVSCPLPPRRISLAATTTVYLVGDAPPFTAGTLSAFGFIEARRVR